MAGSIAKPKEDPAPWVPMGPSTPGPWGNPASFRAAPPGVEPDPDPPAEQALPRRPLWDLPVLHSQAELRHDRFLRIVRDAKDCEPPPPSVIARNRLF